MRWDKQETGQVIFCRANQPERCRWFPNTTEVQGQIISLLLLIKAESLILISEESCFDSHGTLLSLHKNQFNKYHKLRLESKPKGVCSSLVLKHKPVSNSLKGICSMFTLSVLHLKDPSCTVQEGWEHQQSLAANKVLSPQLKKSKEVVTKHSTPLPAGSLVPPQRNHPPTEASVVLSLVELLRVPHEVLLRHDNITGYMHWASCTTLWANWFWHSHQAFTSAQWNQPLFLF